jgi:serine/threonine-protein kinase
VVAAYEYRFEDGQHYCVMQFLEGESLRKLIENYPNGMLWGDAYTILIDLCQALKEIHNVKTVHRDVKPENFMRARPGIGEFKLLDFDTALDGAVPRLTMVRSVVGSGDYMSPEQQRGEMNITQQSDVYALAVVFYELLTGHVPPRGASQADITADLQRGGNVPPQAIVAILKALDQDPANRFPDVDSFRTGVVN